LKSQQLAIRLTFTALGALALSAAVFAMTRAKSGFDPSGLYEGMDRSAIIARYGTPDARKSHDHAERLTYIDGEHYQYLLMLRDDKLLYWEHDRVYKANRFSSIGEWEDAPK
jgi:hypothetical protein